MPGIADVAKGAGLKEEQVKAVTEAITRLTSNGENVTFKGFGSFKVKTRAARIGRNPKTGDPVQISAKSVLTFKASK